MKDFVIFLESGSVLYLNATTRKGNDADRMNNCGYFERDAGRGWGVGTVGGGVGGVGLNLGSKMAKLNFFGGGFVGGGWSAPQDLYLGSKMARLNFGGEWVDRWEN